jgi:type I restriction enzyme S subunit
MSQWKDVKLGDVLTFANGKKIEECDRSLSGKNKIYGSNGVIGYTDKYLVDGETIIIGRVGAFCGSLEYSNQPVWVTDNAIYAKAKEGYDSKFIFLLLSTLNLRQFAGGSAQPLLNQTILKNISVKIPQLQVQEEISSVIFSLTDKIQLNLQMNQTLEEMAMTLYKHWFVDFGPFQDGEFVESELGMIPKGWKVSSLKEFANILMGQSPKSEFYNRERKGLPFHQGVKDFGIRYPVHTVYCTQELRVAKKGDILLSVRAPVGRINIANSKLVIGRGLSALNSKSGHNSFLLYTLKRIFAFEDQYGSGTVFNSISKKDIEQLKFIRPSQEVLDNFEKHVSKFDSLIESNTKEIEELQGLRDYLLPRLLSGEIDVSQAEKQVEEVL